MARYTKIKLLGSGAHGKCYLAKDQTNKQYAIKQTDIKNLTEEEKANAVREGKILEAFSHPYICRFREAYRTSRNKLWLVMDYAEGGDLKTKIRSQNGRKFDEEQIIDWFTQLALALKHVHDRKVIHRDIKSPNIFLTQQGNIKLGDFGIARALENTSDMAVSVVGSPYYLSPEIVNSQPYNTKSDIWSLGVVLYEMCELRTPFLGQSLGQLVFAIVKGAYKPINERYSVSLSNLVDILLSQEPKDRPDINAILKLPIIQERIQFHLSEQETKEEFSHTIIHGPGLFELAKQQKEKEEEKKYALARKFTQDWETPDIIADEIADQTRAMEVAMRSTAELEQSPSVNVNMMDDDFRENDDLDEWSDSESGDDYEDEIINDIVDTRAEEMKTIEERKAAERLAQVIQQQPYDEPSPEMYQHQSRTLECLKQNIIQDIGLSNFEEIYNTLRDQCDEQTLQNTTVEDLIPFLDHVVSEAVLVVYLPDILTLLRLQI